MYRLDIHTWDLIQQYLAQKTIDALTLCNIIDIFKENNISDAFGKQQLASKFALLDDLDTLKLDKARILICGGWIGVLSSLILNKYTSVSVTSIDRFVQHTELALKLNKQHFHKGRFAAITANMSDVNYNDYDIIINTVCEHMPNYTEWFNSLPTNKLVILQNTNFKDPDDHINTVDCATDMSLGLNLTAKPTYYEIIMPLYTRFMCKIQT